MKITINKLLKVVLQGSPRCPDIHDLSECHRLYDLGRHIRPLLVAKNLNRLSLNFDCKETSVRSVEDHLKGRGYLTTVVSLSEAISSLSRRRNSSDGSVLIRRLTEV